MNQSWFAQRCPVARLMLRKFMTKLGLLTGHPVAFVVIAVFVVAWWQVEPQTFDWHAIATIATLFMTVLIQRATHRDTQALHAKLDELLKADANARTSMKDIDDEEPEAIEKHRAASR